VKFTEKGFVKLDISLINGTNSNSKYVLLCFYRIGILKENQRKYAFSQEDSSTTKNLEVLV
jgi:hypothetical protein